MASHETEKECQETRVSRRSAYVKMVKRRQGSYTYLCLGSLSDGLHGEQLTSVILNTTENDKRDGGPLFRDHIQNVRLSERELAITGSELNHRIFWVISVVLHLGCEGILSYITQYAIEVA